MRRTTWSVLRERYADLVRLAYLVLDDGSKPPGVVLAQARRSVREAARHVRPAPASVEAAPVYAQGVTAAGPPVRPARTAEVYAGLRHTLVRRLVCEPPARRWSDRVRRCPAAASEPPGPVRAMLRQMSEHERLAYVLCRLERLSAPEVGAELGEQLVVSVYDVEGTTAEVDEGTALDPAAQRAELRAFDPTLVRLGPPGGHVVGKLAAGVVVAALAAGGAVGYQDWKRSGRPGDPAVVGDARWRRVDFPAVDAWPTMGALRGDRALLRRAATAWRFRRWDPPLGQISVMYAGVVDDATYVIMHDAPGFRDTPIVAQYVERERSRGVESTRRMQGDSGQFIVLTGTVRFLVPPWRTGLEAARLTSGSPHWQRIRIQSGVTGPLPWSWFDSDCQNVIALRMTHQASGSPTAVSLLASHVAEEPTPLVWFRDPDPDRPDTALSAARGQWDALRAIACDGAVSLSLSADLRIGRLWAGRLPGRKGGTTLVTIDAARAADGGTAVLVTDDARMLGGPGPTNGDFSLRSDKLVGAAWWRSARTGRWVLVAAAGAEFVRMELVGELGRHESREIRGGHLLVQDGPPAKGDTPQDGRPAVVQVIAYEPSGARLVITP